MNSEPARAWILILLGAAMIFVAPPAMLYDGRRKAELLSEFRLHGKSAVATVISTSPSYSRTASLTYSFEANGRSYRRTEEVSSSVMDRAQAEGKIDVTFSSANPSLASADPNRLTRSSERLLSWGPWVGAAFGIFIGAIGVHRLRRLN